MGVGLMMKRALNHTNGGTGLLIGRTGCNLCPMGFVNADLGSYTCATPI